MIAEGGALLGGIAVAAVAGTGADCDTMVEPGMDPTPCKNKATILSAIGVTLIVAGLLGFVATVSTAKEEPKQVEIKQETPPPPAETTPVATPPPTEAGSAGSAAAPTPAPDQGSATPPPPSP